MSLPNVQLYTNTINQQQSMNLIPANYGVPHITAQETTILLNSIIGTPTTAGTILLTTATSNWDSSSLTLTINPWSSIYQGRMITQNSISTLTWDSQPADNTTYYYGVTYSYSSNSNGYPTESLTANISTSNTVSAVWDQTSGFIPLYTITFTNSTPTISPYNQTNIKSLSDCSGNYTTILTPNNGYTINAGDYLQIYADIQYVNYTPSVCHVTFRWKNTNQLSIGQWATNQLITIPACDGALWVTSPCTGGNNTTGAFYSMGSNIGWQNVSGDNLPAQTTVLGSLTIPLANSYYTQNASN